MVEEIGKDRTNHRPGADEGGLDGIAGGVLVARKHVADERAERLHRDVEAGVEHPQQKRGHQQHVGFGHQQQGDCGKDGARQEVWPPATQPA